MFKIFDRYIGRQIVFTTLAAVVILSVVLVLGNVFKKLIEEMDKYPELGWGFVIEFIANVMPYSLIFTIPWAFLTSILLVFGRLSADSELTALRMSGLSMYRICAPVFLLGLVLAGTTLWMNVDVSPRSKSHIQQMFFQLATENPAAIFVSDEVVNTLPGYVIYVESRREVDPESKNYELKNLQLVKLNKRDRPDMFVRSQDAFIGFEPSRYFVQEKTSSFWEITVEEQDVTVRYGKIGDDNFKELGESFPSPEIAEQYGEKLVEKMELQGYKETGHRGDLFMTLDAAQFEHGKGIEARDFRTANPASAKQAVLQVSLEELRNKHRKDQPSYMTVSELQDEMALAKDDKKRLSSLRTEFHKRFSLSLACVTFCLIGIPLGVTAQRRETSVGFALSLIIGISYFLFMVVAEIFHEDASAFPHILIWLPNVIFMTVGIYLFLRLSRR